MPTDQTPPNCAQCDYPSQIGHVNRKLDRILKILEGDDVDPALPGLKLRVDRLEQKERRREEEEEKTEEKSDRGRWLVASTLIVLLLERGWHYLTGIGKP